ncbi:MULTISPECIES: acyl-CoA dehydrogenase family protein [Protofrankia]|uniref:Acyl-CoA dehydrogenase domain-containing protein n=1 Tax=Candidatus Protofrankia datiscae TaxID=2716812 RepID=F8B3K2_9ACTN|nr:MULTISPECIES: acyl-CoA dehydrogenase family protein [Protofrankia]AEH07839.1 acyl-CoA dehydrogenase domain-containing protein [Candidatus Protofrankia datiscae]
MSVTPSIAPSRQSRRELLAELAVEFAATAAEHDRSGTFPVANLDRLHRAGLIGLTVPAAYGGAEADLSEVVEVLGTIARGDPSTALVLAMTYIIHASCGRFEPWPAQVYGLIARSAVEEGALANGLRVEPDLGTPARGGIPATTARWTGDGWELSGHKIYSTGAPVLRWMLVWGATDPASDPAAELAGDPVDGAAGDPVLDAASHGRPEPASARPRPREPRIGTFLVPADAPGIEIVRTWDHFGMCATESHDVIFNRVRLDAAAGIGLTPASKLRDPGAVDSTVASGLAAWGGLTIASIYLGVAEAARDWLIGFLHERVPSNLGRPLASLPRFQAAVGEIDVGPTAGRGDHARGRRRESPPHIPWQRREVGGHERRDRRGGQGGRPDRQSRPDPHESPGAPLPERPLRTGAHPPGRRRPRRRRPRPPVLLTPRCRLPGPSTPSRRAPSACKITASLSLCTLFRPKTVYSSKIVWIMTCVAAPGRGPCAADRVRGRRTGVSCRGDPARVASYG